MSLNKCKLESVQFSHTDNQKTKFQPRKPRFWTCRDSGKDLGLGFRFWHCNNTSCHWAISIVFVPLQFGNTCYCNSVLQALYYCKPFRDMVLLYKHQTKNQKKETLLTCLADLFYSVAIQKRKTGSIAPKKFIQRLRKENCKFSYFVFCICFRSCNWVECTRTDTVWQQYHVRHFISFLLMFNIAD